MAIFNVNSYRNNNILGVLDEAVYLNQETVLNADSIPIAESDELGGYLIRFTDLETISENYGMDYIDAAIAVCEANQINPANALIVVDEAELIVNPYLINELDHVIINPQPENSLAYQFCESCVGAWANTGDEDYLYFMLDEGTLPLGTKVMNLSPDEALKELNNDDESGAAGGGDAGGKDLGNLATERPDGYKGRLSKVKNFGKQKLYQATKYAKENPYKVGGAVAGVATAAGLGYLAKKKGLFGKARAGAYHLVGKQTPEEIQQLERIKQEAANKPKTWIGKKIAALRAMYAKYQQKANQEKAAGQAGVFTKIASAILNCIDWLMNKLQNMAG